MKEQDKKQGSELNVVFDKTNYILLAIAVVTVIIGFLLMTGGASEDPSQFNPDEVYSFRRITLAPIIVLLGFGIGIFSIFYKKKQ